MHRHFSKPHFRSKWILKQFNTVFSTAFHMHCFVHACKAALGCSSREAMSIQGCGAGRQPTHTVQCSAQVQQARQGQQAVEQTTTLVGLVSCCHAYIDAKLPPPLPHPTRTLFHRGTFALEAKEESNNLKKELPCQKKINKQELGSEKLISPPSLYDCRGN